MNTKQEFVPLFRQIQIDFSWLYSKILCDLDLTLPQYALLGILAGHPMTMTDAGAKLHISKPAVTYLTDQLEKKRFLARQPDPNDRRISRLKVLPQGDKKVQQVQSEVLKYILHSLDQFSESEQKMIMRFYAVLAKTLEQTILSGDPSEK